MKKKEKKMELLKSFYSLPFPSPSSFARCAPSVAEEVQTSHQNVRSNIIITLP